MILHPFLTKDLLSITLALFPFVHNYQIKTIKLTHQA